MMCTEEQAKRLKVLIRDIEQRRDDVIAAFHDDRAMWDWALEKYEIAINALKELNDEIEEAKIKEEDAERERTDNGQFGVGA